MLILASKSKARSNLLKQLSIKHIVIPSYIDENNFHNSNIKELVKILASAKAQTVVSKIFREKEYISRKMNQVEAILACDSLFEFNGQAFGKPRNSQEAQQRWEKISSKSGILHTGHCLIYRKQTSNQIKGKEFQGILKKVVSTKINFSQISKTEISKYVQTKEPLQCAGGFAIEGKGSIFIESIEGCYSNVIGVSLPWLRKALKETQIASLI